MNENLLEFKFKRGENSISELSPLYQDLDIVIHNKSLSNGEEDLSFSFVKNDNFCKEVDDLETHLSTYKQRASKLLSIINMISDCRNSYDKNNQKKYFKKFVIT